MSANNMKPDSVLLSSREQQSVTEWLQGWVFRARTGDLGQIPVVLGLLAICIVFQIANPVFLTPANLVTLLVQAVTVITLAYGVVVILLLGEIDLSLGYIAGVSAVVIALLLRAPIVIAGVTPEGGIIVPWFVAITIALTITVFIGFLQGFLVTYFRLPSFIVTLAGQLALSGVVLLTVKGLGTLSMRDATVLGTVRAFLPLETGILFCVIVAVAYFVMEYLGAASRQKVGLNAKPIGIIAIQTGMLTLLLLLLLHVAYQSRGIPLAFVLVVVMMVVLSFVTTRTKFGRYLFAVGGNKEAARRAGIAVNRIRVYGFMLGGLMAGIAGIFLLARLASVATDTGGGPLLLNSIAAAVIGGTSLFGGSGKISSALLGGLVISVVDNGLGLIPNIPADAKFILTAAILLLAVIVDSFTRRNAARSGR